MISDVLLDAISEIRDWLDDPDKLSIKDDDPLRQRIERLLVEMGAISDELVRR